MKDLKLNKENLVTLKDEQLEGTVGANGGAEEEQEISCRRKSCELIIEV